MVLRIGYVREHFSTPLLLFADADNGKTFTLVECPSGTGQLISRLKDDEIDVAIALTDPLISGIAKGSKDYKLVGSYVTTPLNWAIITGKESSYQGQDDLKDTTFGISRNGSGSHTMAFGLKFQINNDIDRLIESVNDGSTSAFLWEWFTTKPFVDAGKCRFIGSIPTPWPSWLIAAHPTRTSPSSLKPFLSSLDAYVVKFHSTEGRKGASQSAVKEKFGYPDEDIEAWIKTVGYPSTTLEILRKVISDTIGVLEKAGFIETKEGGWKVEDFVDENVVTLT
ncbi:periplasmic binding protein-like II [Flagelloscypha sp. PMI_526]|nr:periplasmic binding protein-like II [Flagelloscypha sp. PMI_526]